MTFGSIYRTHVVTCTRYIGFTLFMILFGLLDFPGFMAQVFAELENVYKVLSPGCFAIPLLLWGLIVSGSRLSGSTRIGIASACFILASALYIVAPHIENPFSLMLAFVMLYGIGIASGWDVWITSFCALSSLRRVTPVLLCCLVASVFEFLLTALLNKDLSAILLTLLSIANAVCLFVTQRGECSPASVHEGTQATSEGCVSIYETTSNVSMTTIRNIVFFAAIAISVALLQSLALSTSMNGFEIRGPSLLGRMVGLSCILLLWNQKRAELFQGSVLYSANIIMVILALLLSLVGLQDGYLYMFASGLAFSLAFNSLLVMFLSDMLPLSWSVPKTVCVGLGLMYGIIGCGVLLGDAIVVRYGSDTSIFTSIALAVVCVIALSSLGANLIQERRSQAAKSDLVEKTSSNVLIETGEQTTDTNLHSKNQTSTLEKIEKFYGLSKRETELLTFLISGRSVPYIAKQLYLSENTVRGYMKTLYKKLDVHSKQELIDVIEQHHGTV